MFDMWVSQRMEEATSGLRQSSAPGGAGRRCSADSAPWRGQSWSGGEGGGAASVCQPARRIATSRWVPGPRVYPAKMCWEMPDVMRRNR